MDELSTSILDARARKRPPWATLDGHSSYNEAGASTPLIPMKVIEEKPVKIRRTRARGPKVRSGCKTCKKRRLKCDERKPYCLRCEKSGSTCDGYTEPPPSRRAGKPSLLLPQTAPAISTYTSPSTVKFDSQEDYQYFIHFRDDVSIDLSGAMPEELWTQVIPRAVQSESTLRNLTIAVSALDKARHSSSPAYHFHFAAAKYGKALRGIQELISSRPDRNAVRVSIIASMLIFCFENLQGEMELAVKHAKVALNFTRKHLTPTIRYHSEENAISSVPGLEDEVVDSLIRWDNMFILTEYMAGERLLEISPVDLHIAMPREFHNIQEARNSLRKWQVRTLHYLPRLRHAKGLPSKTLFDKIDLELVQENGSSSAVDGSVSLQPGHYERTVALAQAWFKALAPLFMRASANPTSREFMTFGLLQTSGLLTYTAFQVARLGTGSTKAGPFETECVELTQLAGRIVHNPYYRKTFSFGVGLIEAMYLVCAVCQKIEICGQALRILKLAKGRIEMMASAEMFAEKCEGMLQMRFPAVREEPKGIDDVDF